MPVSAERVSKWRLRGVPEVGDEIVVQKRKYQLVELEHPLLTWKGKCSVCRRVFEFTSYGRQFLPVATCKKHRGQHRS